MLCHKRSQLPGYKSPQKNYEYKWWVHHHCMVLLLPCIAMLEIATPAAVELHLSSGQYAPDTVLCLHQVQCPPKQSDPAKASELLAASHLPIVCLTSYPRSPAAAVSDWQALGGCCPHVVPAGSTIPLMPSAAPLCCSPGTQQGADQCTAPACLPACRVLDITGNRRLARRKINGRKHNRWIIVK
jgi:hypothetical protein